MVCIPTSPRELQFAHGSCCRLRLLMSELYLLDKFNLLYWTDVRSAHSSGQQPLTELVDVSNAERQIGQVSKDLRVEDPDTDR